MHNELAPMAEMMFIALLQNRLTQYAASDFSRSEIEPNGLTSVAGTRL